MNETSIRSVEIYIFDLLIIMLGKIVFSYVCAANVAALDSTFSICPTM